MQLKSFGFFPSAVQYIEVCKHQTKMKNHALLRFANLNSLMVETANLGSKALLKDVASKTVSAGRELMELLGVPSLVSVGVSSRKSLSIKLTLNERGMNSTRTIVLDVRSLWQQSLGSWVASSAARTIHWLYSRTL